VDQSSPFFSAVLGVTVDTLIHSKDIRDKI